MEQVITYLSNYNLGELVKFLLFILGLSGIVIDMTPHIKINPIRWCLKNIGKLLNSELYDRIDALERKVDQNILDQENKRVKQIRLKILDFSNSLAIRKRDQEEFEEIFEIYEEYENLLEKHNKTNGRTTRAMKNIQCYYDELPKIGF